MDFENHEKENFSSLWRELFAGKFKHKFKHKFKFTFKYKFKFTGSLNPFNQAEWHLLTYEQFWDYRTCD